ncbi:MAG: hypothetical protein PUP91_37225, partial [Rhizonema sp. PD37]|nr:hypothetical protein [Rhizonema sp. PD37]
MIWLNLDLHIYFFSSRLELPLSKLLLFGKQPFFITLKSSGDTQYFDVQKSLFVGMIIICRGVGGEGELG